MGSIQVKDVLISDRGIRLPGLLNLPEKATGIIIFAHGSGSSRLSSRNQQVARALNKLGLATLLFDLLTEEEAIDRTNVFDISLLSRRLQRVTEWVQDQLELEALPVGYFGASTGAAAALSAAADLKHQIKAVVSRGGRPDMAISKLREVLAPVLLIVGGNDFGVIELNEQAFEHLQNGRLEIVPGATHLFEEPGTLDEVACLAGQWFVEKMLSDEKVVCGQGD
jgi:putative phosphoribosyl transferase